MTYVLKNKKIIANSFWEKFIWFCYYKFENKFDIVKLLELTV